MLKGQECARGFAGHVGAARAPQWQGGRRPFSATGTPEGWAARRLGAHTAGAWRPGRRPECHQQAHV